LRESALRYDAWLIFYLLLVSGVSLKYLAVIYGDVPYSVPYLMRVFVDDELSFVNCIRVSRRNNVHFYRDPRISDRYWHGCSIPLLVTAALMSLNASYATASIIFCFLNTMSFAFALYLLSEKHSIWPWFASLLLLFNGAWAPYYFFNAKSRNDFCNDLVHRITDDHETMGYQYLFSLLSFSKGSSLTIALTAFALLTKSDSIAALIPSPSGSLAVLSYFFLNERMAAPSWLSWLSNIPKLFPWRLAYRPLFKEEAMRGTFYGDITSWTGVFGALPVFAVAAFGWFLPRYHVQIPLLAGLPIVVVLTFVRDGTRFENAVAVCAFYGPWLFIAFAGVIRIMRVYPKSLEHQGGALYVMWVLFAWSVVGGLICGVRIARSKQPEINRAEDLELVNWIDHFVERSSVLLVQPRVLHPAILSGRQLFLGDLKTLVAAGIDIKAKLFDFDRVVAANATLQTWAEYGIAFAVEQIGSFELAANTTVVRANAKYRLVKLAQS
jgi:hypothetical protein